MPNHFSWKTIEIAPSHWEGAGMCSRIFDFSISQDDYPPKSNIDTKNDGDFKLYLLSNMASFWASIVSFWGLYPPGN